jgi:NADH-quinone oxidoreductase subunit L
MSWVAAAVPVLPFLAAAAGMLGGRRLPSGRAGPAGVALAGTGGSAVLALILLLTGTNGGARTSAVALTPAGGPVIVAGTRVDALSAAAALTVALVALAIQVYSIGYMRGDPRYSSYAAFVSLFTAAMLLVVLSADLIETYVGWEVMGICSYFLIGHRWEERRNSAAAVKAFIVTRLGDVGMLFGIFVLGSAAGSFRISAVLAAVPRMPHHLVLAGTLLIVAGVAGKSGQFPLHTWLPDAMAGPAPVSALIHAATMVAAGVYVVATLYPAFLAAPVTLDVLGVIAAISMLGAALAALAQDDLKRVLAYSTISQLAVMYAGLAAGARQAALFHLLTHAAFKALLFLAAGAVIAATGTSLMSVIGPAGGTNGLRRTMPLTFATMTAGFAALAALPPASGFFSKDAVAAALAHAAGGGPLTAGVAWFLYAAALLTVAVTAAYVTRTWLRTFFGPQAGLPGDPQAGLPAGSPAGLPAGLEAGRPGGPGAAVPAPGTAAPGGAAPAPPRAAPPASPGAGLLGWPGTVARAERRAVPAVMRWPLVALAVPAVALGVLVVPFGALRPSGWSVLISVLLAAAGILASCAAWRAGPAAGPAPAPGPLRAAFERAFYLDEFYDAAVVRPVLGLARAVERTDRKVVNGAVEGSGRGAGWLGGVLRLTQNGNTQAYATGVLAGAMIIALSVAVLS